MSHPQFDVVIVGAGAAGLTAAIGLARAGFSVCAVEAAAFPGAENWSGCVYFCENLAHPDVLGPEGVEALAWERRLVERGFFATDGHGLLGMKYRDADAFRHCYTVLRPIYDHHLAQIALKHGVALLNNTTAESLIREGRRVVGVCTQRGPVYADLVFLAEGDASHLVTREGYERFTDPREQPKFLQGIKEVLELPPRAIEERFGVGPEEGVAYEMLLRNGTLRGKPVKLNAGGFLYTNRTSLSVGLVLPADNLHENFGGDPNLLLEWFENLAPLQPWLKEARRSAFGAKIIRGGGAKDIPTLIDDGLAVGGAASAIGIDFPYPNFTGPATAMGLLITQAAVKIRAAKGRFTRDDLRQHYLEPLRRSSYWRDVEFLRRWPAYVKKTQVFFGRQIDLALGSAYVWTRSDRGVTARWGGWLRLLRQMARPHLAELRADAEDLSRALRLKEVAKRPSAWRLLLDGTLNAVRDLVSSPRAHLPAAGSVTLHYTVAGGAEPGGMLPATLRRWFGRFAPVLASAARRVYANDGEPLDTKLPAALRLLVRQVNLLDVLKVGGLTLAAGLSGAMQAGWDGFRRLFGGRPRDRADAEGRYAEYARQVERASDLTPVVPAAAQEWEARLARLSYDTVKASHIHVLWPQSLPEKDQVAKAGLWHVCPAHVYEARVGPTGQVQVVVNFENCIKCETCWRTSDLVDWARDGLHRFVYAVHSPVVARLLADMDGAGLVRPKSPRALTHQPEASARAAAVNGQPPEVGPLLVTLEHKLREFDAAIAEEPRTVDRGRAEYLHLLAHYAQNVAARVVELLRDARVGDAALELASELAAKAEQRTRHALAGRFSWAAGDGRQMRYHHVPGLRRLPGGLESGAVPAGAWLRAEEIATSLAEKVADWRRRLDAVLPPNVWRDLEHGAGLTPEQDTVLLELLAEVPAAVPGAVHAPGRKALLAELGRRDPSLAFRAASHLWSRDLMSLAPGTASGRETASQWLALAIIDEHSGEAIFVPARGAAACLVLHGDRLGLVDLPDDALTVEPLATLGLRGAGLASVRLSGEPQGATIDREQIIRTWNILSSADLISIAAGMADVLCRRAVEHATGRVQFPGLFHDEEARDAIGKFGAVKKMVAEMAARRYLLETLDHDLSPADFSEESARRAALVKALAAEALGSAPGSVSYNAGQVFGGTGYSEDDILSKYYRDAAAWRFLGPENPAVYADHGDRLAAAWDGPGDPLSALPGEAELFDEAAQRKALQPQLDTLRVQRSRLRALVGEVIASRINEPADPGLQAAAAEVRDQLARLDAHLLGGKAMLLRTHARLENGHGCEAELPLLSVWLDAAGAALDDFEGAVRRAQAQAAPAAPLAPEGAGPPVTDYGEFLKADVPYDSGDFLIKPADPLAPRHVPEMIATDPDLAARDRELRELIGGYFGRPRDGLVYERYLEKTHRPDGADLDFLRRHGFFRMPIPKDLGGEGRSKADYYLLTVHTHRLADVGVSLTIQVNSSLGTTPVLVPREKDLPAAQKALSAFLDDGAVRQEVADRLKGLIGLFDGGAAKDIDRGYSDLQKRLDEAVLGKPSLRVVFHRFAQAWQDAGRAGLAYDLPAMRARLKEAAKTWQDGCGRAADYLEEIGRRRAAADLFLQWVSSGQISAFALTEPSAGSDTARVATRARLRSVPVEAGPDGAFTFVPEGAKEERRLLDAGRLEFRHVEDGGHRDYRPFYRWSDDAEPSPIRFDEYDYETDDPKRMRYYDADGGRVHFSDVGQLRERGGRLWYDYWELTGAKMWITNGRMCGIMALYAKTDEGVTGFIVDRHAEGLVVGKDEAKMGQFGSPTNELSLQAVRVPRENVIGLEGRGQVNALETLTVGRGGLAMSAMSQMLRLEEWSRARVNGRGSSGTEWRLREIEELRFISEAIAFDVTGRFEHKKTKSVRVESAIAKMLVSELFHRAIEAAEEIHGLGGQTQRHLVEKRKRDARVLNIYEGTNEIQRYFILRDLGSDVAKRWPRPEPARQAGPAGELEALKADLRERVEAALAFFGSQLWSNPNLQANCFLLAEAAAWVSAMNTALGRAAFLERLGSHPDIPDAAERLAVGRRALARCAAEARARLRRFDGELAALRRGLYAPSVRAASLLFQRAGHAEAPLPPSSRITRPLSVLVVLDAPVPGAPQPRVVEGHLQEPYRVWTEADRAALECALRLRDGAEAEVRVEVIAAGPPALGQMLREAVSLGADRVRLVTSPAADVAPDRAAAAIAQALSDDERFDLVLTGAGGRDGGEGIVGRLTAEALGLPVTGTAAHLAVRAGRDGDSLLLVGADGRQRVRVLPAAVAVEAGLALRPFAIDGYLGGLSRDVEAVAWPEGVEALPLTLAAGAGAAAASQEKPPQPLLPHEAGHLILESVGAKSAPPAKSAVADAPPITDIDEPQLLTAGDAPLVVAVLAAEADGRLRPGARRALDAARFVAQFAPGEARTVALLLTAPREDVQRRAVGELLALCPLDVCVVEAEGADASDEIRARLLAECWPTGEATPAAVVGEPWAEGALAALATRSGRVEAAALRVRSLERERGELVAETALRGGLRALRPLRPAPGRTCWVGVTAEVEVGAVPPPDKGRRPRVERWAPKLERFYGGGDVKRLLEELKEAAGVVRLSDAEFILDVGAGVGNRDGYEAVIEPLERALRSLGVAGLMVGGSRKVTEELHILPADRQIGQSGVSVNPRVLLAVGVSGAPQHLNYIGPRATVVAFNRDAEAPIMTLNQRQPRPKVFPVVGDLFETVPAFTACLRAEFSPIPSQE